MKRSIFTALAIAISLSFVTSCSDDSDGGEANVTVTLEQASLGDLNFGDEVVVSGTFSGSSSVTSIALTGVKQSGESYTAQGDLQSVSGVSGSSGSFSTNYFVDNNTMTHIEVRAYVGSNSKATYLPISSVTGEPDGLAYVEEILMKADTMVWNGENRPAIYAAGEGAESSTPSFFSIHGVEIDGETKHVLSLSEMRAVQGYNGSFCFLNVLENTSKTPETQAYIGSQRGFMFSSLLSTSLSGGTTGRQCDVYEVNGNKINDNYIDAATFKIAAGSWYWAGDADREARYNFVDSLYAEIAKVDATTIAGQARINFMLGKIQTRLDNATLGEEVEPTNLGALTYARQRTNAGDTSTSEMTENFRAGDYIILKSLNDGKYYYGILYIKQLEDDSPYLIDVNGLTKLDKTQTDQLFLKACIFEVKTQTKL